MVSHKMQNCCGDPPDYSKDKAMMISLIITYINDCLILLEKMLI